MHNKTLGRAFGIVVLALLATPRKASAYVDPGSGAMLWQMLAAGFIGTLFYMRRFAAFTRKHLMILITRSKSGDDSAQATATLIESAPGTHERAAVNGR
jgi:hypothetical protein